MKSYDAPWINPSGSKRSVNFKAVVWFVMAVVVIESLATILLPEGFMTNTLKSRLREIDQRPAPVIQVMGDSVSAAIRASILAEALGETNLTVANYSLAGTTPIFTPFALERQRRAGRSPRVIIYAPHPAMLGTPKMERFVARFGTMPEIVSLHDAGARWPDIVYGGLCKLSYTLRYREDLSVALTQGDFGFFQTWRRPATSVAVSEQPFGAPPQEPDLQVEKYSRENLPPQLKQPFAVDSVNLACINLLCDVAAQDEITILWVSMPTIAANVRDSKQRDAFNAFLDELASRHTNFFVLHREIEPMPDGCYADPYHLNQYGAWKFSHRLGGELAAWMKTNSVSLGSAKNAL